MRDLTIRSNTNGLGLRLNAIKDLCPLILHQLIVGWIGKAHGPTSGIIARSCHRILSFLGLANFPAGEPVHVIAPIGATFLRQRAAHLRVGPTRPRGASSGVVPPPPSSTGADTAEASGAAATEADVPPPTTSDDSDIRRTLDHVLTVQTTHGQISVDVLNEIRALRAKLSQFRRSSLPPPFDDGF